MTSYLGISYEQMGKNMFIQMSSYADELLADFEMSDCKPVKRLPYVPDAAATSTQQFDDRSRCASLVGALSYLAQMMRPDIMLTDRLLATYESTIHYTLADWKGAEEELAVRVFSDADFAQQQNRKSITGFVDLLGPNLIDWKSRKQTLVTTLQRN